MRTRLVIATVSLGFAAACGGGGGGTTNPPGTTQRLGSIELTPANLPLTAGSIAPLTAVAKDQQGVLIDGVTGFTYSSSAVAIADVSSTGSVIAFSAGSATITASLTRDGVTRT